MRKIKNIISLAAILVITSCSPFQGALYTDVTIPNQVGYTAEGSKTGTATCIVILGLVATGDCGIEAAAKNGGITDVSTVDSQLTSILFFYAKHTTVVKGE